MSRHIDRFMQLIKWPVAVLSLVLLPGAGWALGDLLSAIVRTPRPLLPFLGGLALYLGVWWLLFRRPAWGSLLSTFEHELTHAIFAWLTLHRVVGLRATWRDGGEIRYRGKGNWLITVAPYFFPTVSVVAACVLVFVPVGYLAWASGLLGLTVAYHMTSTWLETHRRQPDLRRVTLPFAFMFLPTANAMCYGLLVAFALGGGAQMTTYAGWVAGHTRDVLGFVIG